MSKKIKKDSKKDINKTQVERDNEREEKLLVLAEILTLIKTFNHYKCLRIKSEKIENKIYKDIVNIKLGQLKNIVKWITEFKENFVASYEEAVNWIPKDVAATYRAMGITDLPEQVKLRERERILISNWKERPEIIN